MAENTASENDVENVFISMDDKIKGYQVVESIGDGAYGQVFKVSKNAKKYAMKVEPNRLDGGPASITKEIEVMMELNNRGAKFFPIFETGGREPKFHMVVMTLLGENLQVLRMKGCNPKACTPGTWSRIGIQCLFVVKQMHDCGFLHHDLKPANFVWGQSDEVLTSRVFYLIDFGISSKFIRHIKGTPINQQNGFEFRTENKKVHSLVGTPKYTSPKAHAMADLGRGDDFWSLMYMIAELVKPLPWEILEAKMLEKTKLKSKLKDLYGIDAFGKIETMLQACTFHSFPNYEMIYHAFKDVFTKSGASWYDHSIGREKICRLTNDGDRMPRNHVDCSVGKNLTSDFIFERIHFNMHISRIK
ncbi:Protein kinase domain-containing protein [Caenorhabditis elegans]|uniref:Protein kinase domain-containing protein n=1 Tax=Caenorhabditis elegans TaxID=6239 RepID=Q18976_CAEEL|nr:Protein kinase domain-containing protein [Caenorhabditis elegans]CCD63354.1 Protein kinase domain-containing protein [Caenorhabditis elegans]|eukprot:NP_501151.1 Uncharacterized protein CELE_D2024.1 [Caenorhabditis elegans]